jgi:hypothetical protein
VEAGLNGKLGLESWRWLFIIEVRRFLPFSSSPLLTLHLLQGALTSFIAIIAYFILPDYPATTKRLTVRQRAMAVYRLQRDAGMRDDDTATTMQNLKAAVCDYRVRSSFSFALVDVFH